MPTTNLSAPDASDLVSLVRDHRRSNKDLPRDSVGCTCGWSTRASLEAAAKTYAYNTHLADRIAAAGYTRTAEMSRP